MTKVLNLGEFVCCRYKLLIAYFVCFASGVSSFAGNKNSIRYPVKQAPSSIKGVIEKPLVYLKWEEKLYRLKMPQNSSGETQKELAALLKLQAKRTPEIERKAIENQKQGVQSDFWLAHSLNFLVDEKHFPATAVLLDNALSDVESICYRLEFLHLRPLPTQLDSKIKTVPQAEIDHPTFPALPTCRSYVESSILSSLYPPGRDIFSSTAYEVALATEWVGSHFPSDNEAAQKVAETAYLQMKKNGNYLRDFKKAKLEWAPFISDLKSRSVSKRESVVYKRNP